MNEMGRLIFCDKYLPENRTTMTSYHYYTLYYKTTTSKNSLLCFKSLTFLVKHANNFKSR